jgi:hypothetical protein
MHPLIEASVWCLPVGADNRWDSGGGEGSGRYAPKEGWDGQAIWRLYSTPWLVLPPPANLYQLLQSACRFASFLRWLSQLYRPCHGIMNGLVETWEQNSMIRTDACKSFDFDLTNWPWQSGCGGCMGCDSAAAAAVLLAQLNILDFPVQPNYLCVRPGLGHKHALCIKEFDTLWPEYSCKLA